MTIPAWTPKAEADVAKMTQEQKHLFRLYVSPITLYFPGILFLLSKARKLEIYTAVVMVWHHNADLWDFAQELQRMQALN